MNVFVFKPLDFLSLLVRSATNCKLQNELDFFESSHFILENRVAPEIYLIVYNCIQNEYIAA